MKNIFLVTLLIILIGCQEKKDPFIHPASLEGNYIEWLGENRIANELALTGMYHFMNAEQEKAFTYFEEALRYDPSMFAPHVCLAEMSADGSEKQKYHIEQAKKNVDDNNITSKKFVSILDAEPDGYWGYFDSSKALEVWKEMHELEPKGNFIKAFYAYNIKDLDESIEVLEKFANQAKEEGERYGHLLNTLGYKYMAKGDMSSASSYFNAYIKEYEDGYNPYDSMGEFWLNKGDTLTAKSYYEKAIEKFPFARNARDVLSQID